MATSVKKLLLVLMFLVNLPSIAVFAQKSTTQQLSDNLVKYFLTEDQPRLNHKIADINIDKDAGDQVILELYQRRKANSMAIESLLNNFKSDGTWSDINYDDKENSGWELKAHVDRLLLITKEYLSPESKYFNNAKVKAQIHQALAYWFKNMPQNKNWWYNQIGIPKTLGPVLIMLRSELSEQEYKAGLRVMNQSNFGMTGQNKVWLAGNMFYKALLTDDEQLAKQARDTIVSEIKIGQGEGVKADFSFQQHGAQQQFGNYGLAYLTSMASWANIFAGTSFKLDEEDLAVLRNLFDKGYNQIIWKGFFDTNSLGRQFFKFAQSQKALATAFAAYDLMKVDEMHKPIYQDFITRNFGGNNQPLLLGISNYFNSDMMVFRSKEWYASVKMSSERVIGAETGNGENLKGYYLADGACYISVSGKEYDNIFPLWNWRHLPGVTCYESNEPLKVLTFKGYKNGDDFAGSISNNLNGLAAFILNRDSLTAKKAYFFLNNQLICLGAGISAPAAEKVVTSINQTWLSGKVAYFSNGVKTLPLATELRHKAVNWVYHNNITYVPLMGTKIDFSNITQKGSWSAVIAKYPKDSIEGSIFTIKVSAVRSPDNASYAYAVLPNTSAKSSANADLKFEVLQNDNCAQIVKSKDSSVYLLAIYQPLDKKLDEIGTLSFKQPGLYQLDKQNNHWEITLADPTQKLKTMELVTNGEMRQFTMPGGLYKGKAIHGILKNHE
ncbi:MAG TPA: polysaccharide lyase family 8 super-sandwich domain-containing protein [Pelobium sp.]